jgi:micrococcal nuclease
MYIASVTGAGGPGQHPRDISPQLRGKEPHGCPASDYTKAQLTGKNVFLETDAQERDKYGRLLAYVWLSQPTAITDTEIRTRMFNARLLLDGYTQLMTIAPNVKYVDYFTKYQAAAREASMGLWGVSATATAPVFYEGGAALLALEKAPG